MYQVETDTTAHSRNRYATQCVVGLGQSLAALRCSSADVWRLVACGLTGIFYLGNRTLNDMHLTLTGRSSPRLTQHYFKVRVLHEYALQKTSLAFFMSSLSNLSLCHPKSVNHLRKLISSRARSSPDSEYSFPALLGGRILYSSQPNAMCCALTPCIWTNCEQWSCLVSTHH